MKGTKKTAYIQINIEKKNNLKKVNENASNENGNEPLFQCQLANIALVSL